MDELTDDAIAGTWRLFQRRRGHRFSVDDVTTAWEATSLCPEARRYLDLGCGIGSVLIMAAWKLAGARVTGVEAERLSFELAERNVARNGLTDRATLVHGDLRDAHVLARLPAAGFDLITGTPPYQPPGTSTPSPDRQRAHARVEYRGGIEAYLLSAGSLLAPGGRAVMCADARTPHRAEDGAAAAGLCAVTRRDVIPRADREHALFSVWTFARRGETRESLRVLPALVTRDRRGERTEQALALRRFFGLPQQAREQPSP